MTEITIGLIGFGVVLILMNVNSIKHILEDIRDHLEESQNTEEDKSG